MSSNKDDTERLLNAAQRETYDSIESPSQVPVPVTVAANVKADAPESTAGPPMTGQSDIDETLEEKERGLPLWTIVCILSTAFSYGCIFTTLFLITLPVECERIESQHPDLPKSVSLGVFVAIAGVTQLISPLTGMLSDTYRPPAHFELGQRIPYLVLGGICCVVGLFGQYIESYEKLWLRYGLFFFLHMIGINISYAMMIALIPDQVPKCQTGVANGILAFELVTGSLFGFGLFNFFFLGDVQDMYGLYICVVTTTTIMTVLYAHDRDARLNAERGAISLDGANGINLGREVIFGPYMLLKTMLYDPMIRLDWKSLMAAYSIDVDKHHDFFIVTVSRLCYYCGGSIQTFFLYFLHDIIHVQDDPETAVAYLAVLGQISGAFICYPVGVISDRFLGGQRKPFVYLACAILGGVTLSMIFAKTMEQMTVLASVLGAANGMYLTMETSLAVDTLPQDYEDGPSGGNAQLLGIWGVAAFLGSALGPMIGGPLLYIFGHNLSEDEAASGQDYSISGYAVVLGLSTVYFFLSAFALRWVKTSTV